MNIEIILGSVRHPSFTRTLANYLADCLMKRGASLDWVDLRNTPLPITDPDYHHQVEANPSAVVRQFVKTITAADGIILASPLYQGSYLGVLKNALDNLAYNAFLNKLVGLISHGSTAKRCANRVSISCRWCARFMVMPPNVKLLQPKRILHQMTKVVLGKL